MLKKQLVTLDVLAFRLRAFILLDTGFSWVSLFYYQSCSAKSLEADIDVFTTGTASI